jgi:hypothetical protein
VKEKKFGEWGIGIRGIAGDDEHWTAIAKTPRGPADFYQRFIWQWHSKIEADCRPIYGRKIDKQKNLRVSPGANMLGDKQRG